MRLFLIKKVYMGCFSWRSCVSGKSILENKQTVIIFPDNDVLAGTYDGYGRINGIDIYVLFALKYNLKKAQKITEKNTNSYDDIRSKAINIDSTGGPNSGGCGFRIMRKSEYRKDMLYRDLPISFNCPEQGANSGRGIDKRFSGKQKYYSLQKCKDIFAKHPNENWYVEFGWNETLKYNGYIAYIKS